MVRVYNAVAPRAFIVLLVASAVGVGVRIERAQADDCLGTPNATAPSGQHWYYRIDRAKRRRCWFLHPIMRPSRKPQHRTNANSRTIAAAAPATAQTAPPASAGAVAMPSPHVTVLHVKPISLPDVIAVKESPARTASTPPTPPAPRAAAEAYTAAATTGFRITRSFVLLLCLGLIGLSITIVFRRAAMQRKAARPGPQGTSGSNPQWPRRKPATAPPLQVRFVASTDFKRQAPRSSGRCPIG